MRSLFICIILSLWLGASVAGAADNTPSFRIAAIYAREPASKDFICITKAYFNEASRSFPVKLSLDVFDSGNDALSTAEIAKSLASQHYDAVVGTRTSQEALAAGEILNTQHVPFFVPVASNPDVTAGRPFIVRLVSNSNRYGDLLAKYAVSDLRATRAAVVVNASIPFSTANARIFGKRFTARAQGAVLKNFEIIEGFSDFGNLAAEISKFKPDVLYLPLYSPQAAGLYAALAKTGTNSVILSNSGISDGKELFGTGGRPITSLPVRYNGVWNQKIAGELGRLYDRLASAHCPDARNSVRSATAFDTLALLLETLRKQPSLRGLALVDAARSRHFTGVLGPLTFGSDGDPVRALYLFEIAESQPRFISVVE